MFACCYFDIFFQEMHDDDVKIDDGDLSLVRQPNTLPGRSGATCQEQDLFEWGAAFREQEAWGSDAVSGVRDYETRVAMCRKAEATNLCDST
jgi:hypothetical protein